MVYFPLNLPLTYSPIKIQFVPPILIHDSDDSDVPDTTDYSNYFLKIIPPRSNRPGVNYALSEPIILNIPSNGFLSLKLVPSSNFLPIGRYRTEYYRKGNSTPLDVQNWIIPSKPLSTNLSILYTGQPLSLPYNVWSINSVSPSTSFIYENNLLTALGEALQAGITNLTVNYQPALTLDQIVEITTNGV